MLGDLQSADETQSQSQPESEPESGRRLRPLFLTAVALATALVALGLWRRRRATPTLEPPF